MNPLDMVFLSLERHGTPMHLGALLVFQPRPESNRTARQLISLLRERAEHVSQLRQRPRTVWLPPGGAVWEEDPTFRIDDHIHVHHLRKSHDLTELTMLAGTLMSRPLGMSHPLWDLHLITGLDQDRFALLTRLHHAVSDGAGAAALSLRLFDESGDVFAPCVQAKTARDTEAYVRPQSESSLINLLAYPFHWISIGADCTARSLPKLSGAVRQVRDNVDIASATISDIRLSQRDWPLATVPIPQRKIELIEVSLTDLQHIRTLHGGSINDVLLALVTGALHHWTPLHRVDLRDVRALVPVNMRQASNPQISGNHVSGYLCDLPVSEPNPIKRLQTIQSRMDRNKRAGPRQGAGALALLAEQLPNAVHRFVTPTFANAVPLLFDIVVSNVRMPSTTLTLDGAELRQIFPLIPLAPRHAVGVAACTYGDRMDIGFVGSPHTPDLRQLADNLRRALTELVGPTGLTEAPGQRGLARDLPQ